MDGSSKLAPLTIGTASFTHDTCGYKNPTILKARTNNTDLSYDYIMVKGACRSFSPAILDTDGALRWVGTTGLFSAVTTLFDNAVYLANGTQLYRNELDGSFPLVGDYSSLGVTDFHHNNDHGKVGMILEADTATAIESLINEVDAAGNVLKQWNMVHIITAAMVAGGDDPTSLKNPLRPFPGDWFHNNAVTYDGADDSLIVPAGKTLLSVSIPEWRNQMDSGGPDETMVPVPVAEAIRLHGCTREPSSNRATRCLDHLRSEPPASR